MMTFPLYPAVFIDMTGSLLIIVLSFLSLRYAFLLTRKQPENFLWGFLFYLCLALTAFSISRACGHLLKQILLISDNAELWQVISPFSGGFNTMFMISLAAVTIYYHKGVEAYQTIEQKAESLKSANSQLEVAAGKLQQMNFNLEEMVNERTAELSISEKKFRNFFSSSKDMIYFCNSERQLVDMNASGYEMLGYDSSDVPNLNLWGIFREVQVLEDYFETMAIQGFVKDLEVEFVRADGSPIYVLLTANAIYDDMGEFLGCEGIAKDLTRVKTMMEQLSANEKMASVGQMAAGVAHEINTPLGVILGYSQLMMDDFSVESEEFDNLKIIERQTKSCRKIVADLLKFSRQSVNAEEPLYINDLLIDVLAVTEHSLNMDLITVEKNLASDLPVIMGDTEKLRQVFVNFINNAHHAMEKDKEGKIYFSTSYDSTHNEIEVTVRDTGHGISNEIKAKIFDPFFTTKSIGKGTGLGLSVSYGIVQEHDGVIEVESPVVLEETGETVKGTAFHVRFPVGGDTESGLGQNE